MEFKLHYYKEIKLWEVFFVRFQIILLPSLKLLLKEKLGEVATYGIRTTTLFERVAKDGREWFKNIHHDKGEYQLNKSRIAHEQIYNAITNLGVMS